MFKDKAKQSRSSPAYAGKRICVGKKDDFIYSKFKKRCESNFLLETNC